MKKWKLWTGLTAIFLSGIVVGFALGGVHAKRTVEHLLSGENSKPHALIVNKISRELSLTESQRAHLENVVCRTKAELFKMRQLHQPEIERILSAGVVEMKGELTEEQSRKLDALHEHAKKRWGRWKGRMGKEGKPECD